MDVLSPGCAAVDEDLPPDVADDDRDDDDGEDPDADWERMQDEGVFPEWL